MKKLYKIITIFSIFILSITSCKKTVTVGTKTLDVSKTYTVFISQSAEKSTLDLMRKGFIKGMVEKGFVENVNVTYIYENAKSDKKIAEKIADLAIEKKPDLIVGIGATSVLPLSEKIKDTPIVFLGCQNADRLSLCAKDSMPIGNVTGVRDSHMLDVSLSYISTNHANVKKLGMIYDTNNQLSTYIIDYLKFYATGFDIDIYTVGIKRQEDIHKAIQNIEAKVDAILLDTDDMINANVDSIVDAFTKVGKPVFAIEGEVENTKLTYTCAPDKSLVGYEAADIVYLILKGNTKLKDIKVRDVNFKK